MKPRFTVPKFSGQVLLLFLALGVAAPVIAAPPSPKQAEEAVAVPTSFLASRLVQPVGAAGTTYRVVVDVPPASSARGAKPRITDSSGDGAVDSLAWNYVQGTLRSVPRLAEQNRTRELRFPLRLTPAAISLGGMKIPEKYAQKPRDGFTTPVPPYPAWARFSRVSGSCQVRATYPAAGGPPRLALLEASTGDARLDAYILHFVLLTWQAAPAPAERTKTTTVVFQLR